MTPNHSYLIFTRLISSQIRDTTDPDQNYNETTIEELGITYPEVSNKFRVKKHKA